MYSFSLANFLYYSSITAIYLFGMFWKSIMDKDLSNPKLIWVCFENIKVKLFYNLGKKYSALSELSVAIGQFREIQKMLWAYKVHRLILRTWNSYSTIQRVHYLSETDADSIIQINRFPPL